MTNDQWTNKFTGYFKREMCAMYIYVCLYAPRQGFYTSSIYLLSDTGTCQAKSLGVNYIMLAFVLICLMLVFFHSFHFENDDDGHEGYINGAKLK